MANSDPSRIGQNKGAGDVTALFLDLAAGEVLTSFERMTIMRDKHKIKQLAKGKSFKFPAIWKASGGYHVPGVEILGRKILQTEVTVTPDDKLISDVFLADLDEILAHFEVRQEYTKQIGEYLAYLYDRNVFRSVIKASRGPALFTGDTGGGAIVAATMLTDGNVMFDAIAASKEVLHTKDVPIDREPVYAAVKLSSWYLMSRLDKNLNRDYNGGQADRQKMTLETIDGIKVLGSNITPFGEDTVTTPGETQADGTTITVPLEYRQKLGTTAGIVWTPMSACSAMIQDLAFQVVDQPEKQGTLMFGRLTVGTRPLRTKCAVELRTGAIPA